jgi:hypothetical protein
LARRPVLGLKSDAALARMWYERAAKLGSTEASLRLRQLTKPSQARSSPGPIASGSEVLRR